MSIRKITLIALSVCILLIQEYAMMWLPNVQLSCLLIFIYSRNFQFKDMLVLLFCYVLIDNLLYGGLNPLFTVSMFIAWLLLVIYLRLTSKQEQSELKLAITGCIFGFIYGWIFALANIIVLDLRDVWGYFLADLPFEIIFAVTSFVTIYWLYKPLNQSFQKFMHKAHTS